MKSNLVEMCDTDRFRAVSRFFKVFWKPRKRDRKKGKIRRRNTNNLATRGYGWQCEIVAVRFANLIIPEEIAFISLFKYFIS